MERRPCIRGVSFVQVVGRVGVRVRPAAVNQPKNDKLIYNQGPGCVW